MRLRRVLIPFGKGGGVCAWGYAHAALEGAVKIGLRGKAALVGNFGQGFFGGGQQGDSTPKADLFNKFAQRFPRNRAETLMKIGGAEAEAVGKSRK